MIKEINGLGFTRRGFLDFAANEDVKEEIEEVVEEVINYCTEKDMEHLVNRVYVDLNDVLQNLSNKLNIAKTDGCCREVTLKVYDLLVESNKLYEASNGLIFDFRIENSVDEFMNLDDALAFLRWQMGLDVFQPDNEVECMLDNIFCLESWREVEFQGEYTRFWFDAQRDLDGRIKFNMEVE